MAKEKLLSEYTPEELQALVAEQKAEIEALNGQLALTAESVAKVDALETENAELKLLVSKETLVSKAVPGTFKSKKHGVTIRFKDGARKTRVGLDVIDSAELMKNEGGKYTDALNHLIELGASFIEVVEK